MPWPTLEEVAAVNIIEKHVVWQIEEEKHRCITEVAAANIIETHV